MGALNMFKICDSSGKQIGGVHGNYESCRKEKVKLEKTGNKNLKIIPYEVNDGK